MLTPADFETVELALQHDQRGGAYRYIVPFDPAQRRLYGVKPSGGQHESRPLHSSHVLATGCRVVLDTGHVRQSVQNRNRSETATNNADSWQRNQTLCRWVTEEPLRHKRISAQLGVVKVATGMSRQAYDVVEINGGTRQRFKCSISTTAKIYGGW